MCCKVWNSINGQARVLASLVVNAGFVIFGVDSRIVTFAGLLPLIDVIDAKDSGDCLKYRIFGNHVTTTCKGIDRHSKK